MTKRGNSFGYESSHFLGGDLVYEIFVRGSADFEGCSEDFMYLFLFSILDTFISCTWVL